MKSVKLPQIPNEVTAPTQVLLDPRINTGPRLLYLACLAWAGTKGVFEYQTKQLSDEFHVSESTMRGWINALCLFNFIRLETQVTKNGIRQDVIRVENIKT